MSEFNVSRIGSLIWKSARIVWNNPVWPTEYIYTELSSQHSGFNYFMYSCTSLRQLNQKMLHAKHPGRAGQLEWTLVGQMVTGMSHLPLYLYHSHCFSRVREKKRKKSHFCRFLSKRAETFPLNWSQNSRIQQSAASPFSSENITAPPWGKNDFIILQEFPF